MQNTFKVQSNTPLKNPPADYCPDNSERWFELPSGLDAGKTLFYYDHTIGQGKPTSTVVFVHGNPESSYTYRHVRDELVSANQKSANQNCRLIGIDNIGYGLSDQASFEMVDMHHADNVLQLIQHLDLKKVTLVIHDWGGPIGVGAFIQEPWRVRNLVVLNTTVFPMPSDGITYKNYPINWLPWCKTPNIIPDALWAGVAAYVVPHASPQGTIKFLCGTAKYVTLCALGLLKQGSVEYTFSQPFKSKMNARSSKRMVRQTPVWGHGYRYNDKKHGVQDNHHFYQQIQDNIAQHWGKDSTVQVAGFFGQWDACGKDSVVEQWQSALPQMKEHTYKYADVGHFIEEQKGAEIAQAILKIHNENTK